jgi:ATP-dependent helicase/nuclease subunit A
LRPSWWQRVEPLAALATDAAEAAAGVASATPKPAHLKVLPPRSRREATAPAAPRPEPVEASSSSTAGAPQLSLPFGAEIESAPPASVVGAPERPDHGAAPLGRAVHRVLEWAAGRPGDAGSIDALVHAAAREFGVAADAVRRAAAAILAHPDTAPFFVGPQILWSGNEVAVSEAGEVLRIDRLVQLAGDAGPVWWVLDYKLHHAPETLAAHRTQLARYRRAVERVQPGATVRCAFVTGEGRVVELG